MKLTRQQTEDLGKLAGLQLSPEELDQFTGRINELLEQFEKLREVDTTDVKPTTHVMPICNVFREDKILNSLSPEEVLANGPEVRENCFVVPRVVES